MTLDLMDRIIWAQKMICRYCCCLTIWALWSIEPFVLKDSLANLNHLSVKQPLPTFSHLVLYSLWPTCLTLADYILWRTWLTVMAIQSELLNSLGWLSTITFLIPLYVDQIRQTWGIWLENHSELLHSSGWLSTPNHLTHLAIYHSEQPNLLRRLLLHQGVLQEFNALKDYMA